MCEAGGTSKGTVLSFVLHVYGKGENVSLKEEKVKANIQKETRDHGTLKKKNQKKE